jgi:hypothetical protein
MSSPSLYIRRYFLPILSLLLFVDIISIPAFPIRSSAFVPPYMEVKFFLSFTRKTSSVYAYKQAKVAKSLAISHQVLAHVVVHTADYHLSG